jgi:hypothetical protein
MKELDPFTSEGSTNLELIEAVGADFLPEAVQQALEDVLVNCRTLRFDSATGKYVTTEPLGMSGRKQQV